MSTASIHFHPNEVAILCDKSSLSYIVYCSLFPEMNQNNFNSNHFRFKHTKRCYAMNWTPKRFDDLSSSAVIWNPPPWRDSILCERNYSRGGDNILCWPNPCKLFLDVVSSPPADNFTTGVTVCGGRKHVESPLDLHVNKIYVTKLFTFRLVLPWNLGWLMY